MINSPGGSIDAGMLIYDIITNTPAPVKMYCMGKAYSMAAILFASGSHGRYILRKARHMNVTVLDVLQQEYFFERGCYPVQTKSYDVFADAAYKQMLKVAAKAEREEAKQKRMETEEMVKEPAEMEATIEKEEAFHDLIADLGNLDEE